MISFRRVSIYNFFSIGQVILPLDTPGTFLVTAATGKRGAFSSNGSGKTSLFEAVIWCLFGRTLRELPFDDNLIRTGSQVATVTVLLDVNGTAYEIVRSKRSGKATTLEINDPRTKERLYTGTVLELNRIIADQLLQCSFDVFVNTVYFPQGRFTFFTQANDKDKKKIFDRIIGTDYFEKLEAKAKAKVLEISGMASEFVSEKTNAIQKLEFMAQRLEELDQQEKQADETLAQELKAFIPLAKDYCETLRIEMNALIEEQKAKADYAQQLDDQMRGLQEGLRTALNNIGRIDTQILKAQNASLKLKNKFDNYKKLIDSGSCPTCLQSIMDRAAVDEALLEMQQALLDSQAEEDGLAEERVEAVKTHSILDQKVKDAENPFQAKAVVRKIQADVDETRKQIEAAEIWNNRKKQILAKHEGAKQGILEQRKKLATSVEDLGQTLAGYEMSLEELDEDLRLYDFWVEGFGSKGIRALIFENLMPFVNERANYYSALLTDGTITINVSATSELKSGEIREKISVSAVNQEGASVYEGNSGGERKRVDLCILLALQDLVMARSGAAIQLSVYDEVLDELDDEGMERVVELLKEKGKSVPVFLISHNAALKGYFEDRIEVSKTDGMTSL